MVYYIQNTEFSHANDRAFSPEGASKADATGTTVFAITS